MDFKTLNLISLILIVIGFVVLGIFYFFYQPTEYGFIKDNTTSLEKVVFVSGNIKHLVYSENNLMFDICKLSSCLPVVYFNSSNSNLLNKYYLNNQPVKITGKLTTYNNKLELILYKFEGLDVS